MSKQNVPKEASAPTLQFIKLKEISPSSLNPRKTFDQVEMDELAASILKVGVIQPITVRPTKPDLAHLDYEIVCGERRFRAAIRAGLTEIPASIRELTDQEAMELMVTENLQRKDVSPLEEADAFVFMQEHMNYEVASIAAKIGKPESYVVRRLQLIHLDDDLKKILNAGDLTIGHAELLSRVNINDQKVWFKDKYSSSWGGGQGTIRDLRSWLKTKSERSLSAAPFKQTAVFEGDHFVSPTCKTCPRNSENNITLFPEHDNSPICHDSHCYEAKCNAAFTNLLNEALADKEVVLINDTYGDGEKLQSKLKKDGFTVLKKWDDYDMLEKPKKKDLYRRGGETDDQFDARFKESEDVYKQMLPKAVKAFHIAGSDRGKYTTIILKSNTKTADKLAQTNPAEANKILRDDIQQKLRRGRELDAEKVMKKLVDILQGENKALNELPPSEDLSNMEMNCLVAMCYDKMGYSMKSPVNEYLELGKDFKTEIRDSDFLLTGKTSGEKLLYAIMQAPRKVKLMIIRNALFNNFRAIYPEGINGAAIFSLSQEWISDDYKKITLDQEGVRDRREGKLNKQLEDLAVELKAAKLSQKIRGGGGGKRE